MKHTIPVAVFVLTLIAANGAFAQFVEYLSTENQYVEARVQLQSGQFQITTPDGKELTYINTNSGDWTTYTEFAMNITGKDVYYTNMTLKYQDTGFVGGYESQIRLPDTVFKIGDTIRAVWQNGPSGTQGLGMNGFRFTQNLWPVVTGHAGQIMIQYTAQSLDANNQNNVCNGILLVLDNAVYYPRVEDNCAQDTHEDIDNPRVVTSLHYDAYPEAVSQIDSCWYAAEDFYTTENKQNDIHIIPEWYLAGMRFPDYNAYGADILGKGMLQGPGLVPPNEFMVGDLGIQQNGFLDSAWNFDSLVIPYPQTAITDLACGYKWVFNRLANGLSKTVATSYGTNDFSGNFSICNNGPLMTMVHISPTDHRRYQNLQFDSLNTHVDVYVADADHLGHNADGVTVNMDMSHAPHFAIVDSPSQALSTPLLGGGSSLDVEYVGHASWNLALDTTTARVNQDYSDTLYFSITNTTHLIPTQTCMNPVVITYHAYQRDVTPPSITVNNQTTTLSDWIVSDNSNFYDTGLDSIVVVHNTNYTYTPPVLIHCVPTQGAHVIVSVTDTTKRASFVFRAVDCSGNSSVDSVSYTPSKLAVGEPVTIPSGMSVVNYPDPFSRTTQILISDELAGEKPQIRVYSTLGTDVTAAGIVSSREISGARVFTFDGGVLPAGLYTVAIVTTHGVMTHQMMLLK